LGSWSLTPGAGTWDDSSWSIESSMADANLYSFYPFFLALVGTDDKNSSANMIVVCIIFENGYHLPSQKYSYLNMV